MKKIFFVFLTIFLISCFLISCSVTEKRAQASETYLLLKNVDTGKICILNPSTGNLQDTGKTNYLKISPGGKFGLYEKSGKELFLVNKQSGKERKIFSGHLIESFLWINNSAVVISASKLRPGVTKVVNVYEDILPTQIWIYRVSSGSLKQITNIASAKDGISPAVVLDALPSGKLLAHPTTMNYFEGIQTYIILYTGKILKPKFCISANALFVPNNKIIYSKVIYKRIGNKIDLNARLGLALFLKDLSSGKERRIYFSSDTEDRKMFFYSMVPSPDRNKIALAITDFKETEILVMNKDGAGIKKILSTPGVYKILQWIKKEGYE